MATKKAEKKEEDLLSVDDAFLKRYVDLQGSRAKIEDITTGEQVDLADLSDVVQKQEDAAHRDADLNEALRRGKKQAQAEKRLHERAKKMDAASEERLAKERRDELEQQRVQAESKEEKEKAKTVRDVRHVTQGVNKALENVNPLLERVGTLPTLGGVGLMVAILLILLVVVIPVNAQGDTRAKQFWYMLNGRAKLQGAVTPTAGSQVIGGTGTTPGSSNPGGIFQPPGSDPGIGTPGDPGIGPGGLPNPSFTSSQQNGAFHTPPATLGF